MATAAPGQWPISSAYREAIQNPRICFEDVRLRTGTPARNRLGPMVFAGNFGCVFQLKLPSGAPQGVKCFTRSLGDHELRYRAISDYFARTPYAPVMEFDYRPRGLLVKGQSFPFLLMEWVTGVTLDTYIERVVRQPGPGAAIGPLVDSFAVLVEGLESRGIAHGDLQHGNLIVSNGGLRLVDLDGMYVPALAGMAGAETGLPAYQHPRRTRAYFGPRLDRFAALVIYLSLLALRDKPGLWRLHNDDNSLLLKKEDYRDLVNSPRFAELRAMPGEVRRLAEALAAACAGDIDDVPSLPSLRQNAGTAVPAPAAMDVRITDRDGDFLENLECPVATAGSGAASGYSGFTILNDGAWPVRVTLRSSADWLRVLPPLSVAVPAASSHEVEVEAVVPGLRLAPLTGRLELIVASWLPGQKLARQLLVEVPAANVVSPELPTPADPPAPPAPTPVEPPTPPPIITPPPVNRNPLVPLLSVAGLVFIVVGLITFAGGGQPSPTPGPTPVPVPIPQPVPLPPQPEPPRWSHPAVPAWCQTIFMDTWLSFTLSPASCASVGQTAGGKSDYYTFNLQPGRRVALAMRAEPSESFDPLMRVYDPGGAKVGEDDDDDADANDGRTHDSGLDLQLTDSGFYVLEATAYKGAGRYTVFAISVPSWIAAGCRVTPTRIGETLRRGLAPADCASRNRPGKTADNYVFYATAGETVVIDMDAGGSWDTYLFLQRSDGTLIGANDDRITDDTTSGSRISFDVPTTGVYVIEATAFSEGARRPYALSIR